ncbi:MAG: cyclomaltodextrinase N-terminal domain-containing protein, partial [Woeseiaceae bacterium]|nr:cyclomaltodextrinase N-terminal domain-containing protein [Woeseiaceae bacterium]
MRSQIIRLFLLFGLAAGLATPAFATGIERVEPPSWWTGFRHPELQLLVYGPGIGAADVAVDYPGVTIARIERTDRPNYLFVYLAIEATTAAGTFDIRFTAGDERLVHRYTLRPRSVDPDHVRGITPADVIYLVTPDRFVNGDPENDTVAGYGDALDRSDDYGRHGGDLAGVAKALDYVAGMGFTALWLNPVLENAMPESSYHGYATTDFYRVDPRFGDNAQYRALVEAAKARGLMVIMD